MFRAAINLFRLWGLSDEQAATLVDLPVRSYRRWKAGEVGMIPLTHAVPGVLQAS